MRLVATVLAVLFLVTAAFAIEAPDWKKAPVFVTGEIICGEDYVRGEMRDNDPTGEHYLMLFYLKNETVPFVMYDTADDLVYVDVERDGVFDFADHPGPNVGMGACETLDIVRAKKKG